MSGDPASRPPPRTGSTSGGLEQVVGKPERIDQQSELPDPETWGYAPYNWQDSSQWVDAAQTFTAGRTGLLTALGVGTHLPSGAATVRITDGSPAGTVLASFPLANGSTVDGSTDGAMPRQALPAPIAVEAGHTYAIVISIDPGTVKQGLWQVTTIGMVSSTYGGGQAFVRSAYRDFETGEPKLQDWTASNPEQDLRFVTWVEPA